MNRVNRALCRDSSPEQFVSIFYMVVERDGSLTYANAGHCRPLLFHKDTWVLEHAEVDSAPAGQHLIELDSFAKLSTIF